MRPVPGPFVFPSTGQWRRVSEPYILSSDRPARGRTVIMRHSPCDMKGTMDRTSGRPDGFTLVELLVVIAIIGMLSTIAVVSLSDARRKGRDTKRIGDMKSIQVALELYNNNSNGYPSADTPVVLGVGDHRALCAGGFKAACDPGEEVFMGLVPKAPAPADGTCSGAENDYSYSTPGGGEFQVTFCTGFKVGDLVSGAHIASPSGLQ